MESPQRMECHRCGAGDLELDPGYPSWRRVTSDCKPWPAGGQLALCRDCHLVQAPATRAWEAGAREIYEHYAIYHQSDGAEQSVFRPGDGQGRLRSDALVQALAGEVSLPPSGRLLDVGCGNGSFLRAWNRLGRSWTLCGLEVNDRHRVAIEAIPGVSALYVGDYRGVPGQFDLVSLIHVLEHLPSPQTVLIGLRSKIKAGGLLLVQVPDCAQNPFMLLVADHCSHFAVRGLATLVEASGFQVMHATNQWISKEVTVVARRTTQAASRACPPMPSDEAGLVFAGGAWLEQVVDRAATAKTARGFGIFGTSIAATWLQTQLGGAATFFVDEDPNRIGRRLLGQPILSPAQIPSGATVYVALPQPLASAVAARVARSDRTLIVPPGRER